MNWRRLFGRWGHKPQHAKVPRSRLSTANFVRTHREIPLVLEDSRIKHDRSAETWTPPPDALADPWRPQTTLHSQRPR